MADVACGTGDLCRDLALAGLRPVGVDLSWGMLPHARTGAPLVQADGLRLPLGDGSVDGLTCGFALRNVVDLDATRTASAPGSCDPAAGWRSSRWPSPGPAVRVGHRLYFGRVVPWVGARLSDAPAYRYLPRSVAYLPPTPELLARLRAAGFAHVERRTFSLGVAQLITATRAGAAMTRHRPAPGPLLARAWRSTPRSTRSTWPGPERRGLGEPGPSSPGGARRCACRSPRPAPTRRAACRRRWPPSASTVRRGATVMLAPRAPLPSAALPFDPRAPADAVVPALQVRQRPRASAG